MAKKSNKSSSTGGLVVGSKVKAYIKSKKFKSSGDLVDALSSQVAGLLDLAIARAKANKRSTVRPTDL